MKQIYSDLKIPQIYAQYEERSFKELSALINGQKVVPKAVFDDLLAKIYKRAK